MESRHGKNGCSQWFHLELIILSYTFFYFRRQEKSLVAALHLGIK